MTKKYNFIQYILLKFPLWVLGSLLFFATTTTAFAQEKAEDFFALGKKNLDAGDATNAVVAFNKAIFLKNDYAEAYQGRAQAKMQLRLISSAKVDFDSAVSISPKNITYYFGRATLCALTDQIDEAIADYKKILDIDIDQKDARHEKARLLMRQKKYRLAWGDYNYLVFKNPKDIQALFGRSTVNYALKNVKNAIEDCNAIIELDKKNIDAHLYRGIYQYATRKNEEALKDFDKVISLGKKENVGEAYYYKALTYFEMKKNEEGCKDLKKAQELGVNTQKLQEEKKCQ